VDAVAGAIIDAYNGPAHGSSVGVRDDMMDLASLTTMDRGKYRLMATDN
jgi:hypothetical protein